MVRIAKPAIGLALEEQKESPFAKWLIEKDERFYTLFLISAILLFGILTLISRVFVAGVVVSGTWLVFYYTILRKK